MTRMLVIGAGAAGLSSAYRLQRAGVDVTVLEASEQLGGRCRTVQVGDYRFDIGAGAIPDSYDAVRRFIDDVGQAEAVERRGVVIGTLADGAVHHIDRRRPHTFLQANHLSWREKAELRSFGVDLARIFRSLNDEDLSTAARFDRETVAEWSERKALSPALRERFVAALCRALFLVEPERTSVVDLFSASKSLLFAGHLLTHPDGVDFFLEAAADCLDVSYGAPVSSVEIVGRGARVRWLEAGESREEMVDGCVLAVPAPQVGPLFPGLDDARASYLSGLDHARGIVVHLGLRVAPDERSSMVLVPRETEPAMPVVGLGHNLAPRRAPAGGGVLTAFLMHEWSVEHEKESDEVIADEVKGMLARLFPSWPLTSVEARSVTRWNPALVASEPGTYRDLEVLHRRDHAPLPVQLAGDYLARSSVNGAVRSGEIAAERLIQNTKGPRP